MSIENCKAKHTQFLFLRFEFSQILFIVFLGSANQLSNCLSPLAVLVLLKYNLFFSLKARELLCFVCLFRIKTNKDANTVYFHFLTPPKDLFNSSLFQNTFSSSLKLLLFLCQISLCSLRVYKVCFFIKNCTSATFKYPHIYSK